MILRMGGPTQRALLPKLPARLWAGALPKSGKTRNFFTEGLISRIFRDIL